MNSLQFSFKSLIVCVLISASSTASAISFLLPDNPGDSLIKEFAVSINKQTIASRDDDLLDIARRFDLGQNEIIRLNPTVDRWLPKNGEQIQLQSERLLPEAPHSGLVLNLPEFRLYFFPKPNVGEAAIVTSHPISIGRQDWDTPLGITRIIEKKKNPTWTPPASIKKEHAEKGDPLPDVVPAGPDNPLGLYAMRLGIPGYLIHSTNKPYGVGMRVSHGCIRMYPEDIAKIFQRVQVNTLVTIVNQAVKVGWYKNSLYIEVHPSLESHQANNLLGTALDLIEKANNGELPVISGAALKKALNEKQGIPVRIYERSHFLTSEDNNRI